MEASGDNTGVSQDALGVFVRDAEQMQENQGRGHTNMAELVEHMIDRTEGAATGG